MYRILNSIGVAIVRASAAICLFTIMSGCGEIAPTVVISPEKKIIPSEDRGTLNPQVQEVIPGGLQTLDIPQSYPTDVPMDCPGMVVIFSTLMENDGGEMSTSIELVEEGVSIPVYINYGTASTSSRYFTLTADISGLPLGHLNPDTEYGIRIYASALADDTNVNGPLPVKFDNLVETPATSLNPAEPLYVEYRFRTCSAAAADKEPPILWYTDPGNGSTNIDPWLAPGGSIEIYFTDNIIPMINPLTVHNSSVTLYNITEGVNIPGSIDFVDTDSDFKTFRFIPSPDPFLPAGREFRLRISVSASPVQDFSGNSCAQTDIYFTTAP